MDNFVIENTDDFNLYLMQLISKSEDNNNDDDKVCLITNEKLTDNYITMACKHKFNYIPLINEFLNQKKINHYETTHLRNYELKCPYCRHIQNGVIPYCKNIYEKKLKGINWPPSKMYCNNTCTCIIKSGKRKGQACGKRCVGQFCKIHNKIKSPPKEVVYCVQILKTGKRKGEVCGAKCKGDECLKHKLCKRHIKFKKIIKSN